MTFFGPLHAWTLLALQAVPMLQTLEHAQVCGIVLCTDGNGAKACRPALGISAGLQAFGGHGSAPAWAVVDLAHLADGVHRFMGFCSGRAMPANEAGPDWIGAYDASVLSSEASAIAWALRWVATSGAAEQVEVVFKPQPT